MYLLIWFVVLVMVLLAFERFYLRGKSFGDYPPPAVADAITSFGRADDPGPEHLEVVRTVKALSREISTYVGEHNLRAARETINSLSDARDYVSTFSPADAGGVAAEWVVAPGADNSRRVLYVHGGGFIMGSPKSHRTITSKFSEVCGCAVLAIDYRLMPENSHMDGFEDCRNAYHWLLENGPDGPAAIQHLIIAGDSAGGNLTLALAAWVRDKRMRTPDAIVALSPLTDLTFSGASIRGNEATDIMLKPIMRPLNLLPPFMKSWWVVWTHRMRPCNPIASPLLGDLSDLPPTLVQVSEAEMLLDDARRYVYKAHAAGSSVKLQSWPDMVHVWQIFDPLLPQAVEAWTQIGKFIQTQTRQQEP